jgi:putative addiction module component (TIGR02574 family)
MPSAAPKPTAEQVLEQALQLPKEQRLRLADELWDSVDGEEGQGSVELDPELREELVRRLKKIEDGSAVLQDGDEVMRGLRAKYER